MTDLLVRVLLLLVNRRVRSVILVVAAHLSVLDRIDGLFLVSVRHLRDE